MKKKTSITLINYANSKFRKAQKLNSDTGKIIGKIDKVISYTPKDIDIVFYKKNKHILDQKRGNGYWLWKPYFIKKALEKIEFGEYLFYCDSGAYFHDSISDFFAKTKDQSDIICFEIPYNTEKEWTKKDTFILMDCDRTKFQDSKQILASYSLWKKTTFSIKFVDEWINYAQDSRILTDQKNNLGFSNHSNFKEHRHDQSIFSLLTKKYNIKPFRDPSQFGNSFANEYSNSDYKQFIKHTRMKNNNYFKVFLKFYLKKIKQKLN